MTAVYDIHMKVLGIDPGFDRLGFGMIEEVGTKISCLEYGCVYTDKKAELLHRIQHVYQATSDLIKKHQPDAVVVEQLFFQKNVTTAMNVGMARGVILLAIAESKKPLIEITPNQVKQGITGYGSADKRQVQDMVQRLLGLTEKPSPDDAADALAIAIVGAQLVPK